MFGFGKIFYSLRARFVISLVLIEVIMLALLVGGNLRTLRESQLTSIERYARNLTHVFADTAGRFLIAYDHASLESYASRLLKERSLVYVLVLDEDGKQAAHAGATLGGLPSMDESIELVTDGVYDIAAKINFSGKVRGEVRMGFSFQDALATFSYERSRSIAIAIAAVALSVLVAWVIGYGLTRRLGQLVRGTEEVARGEYGHQLSVGGPDEVQRLTRGFNSMLHTIHTRIQQLETSRQWFRSLVDNSPDCVLLTDLDFRIEYMSPPGLKIFSLDRMESAVGRMLEEWFDEGGRDRLRLGLISVRDGSVFQQSVPYRDVKGGERWLDVVLAPVRNADGNISSILGNLRDVTTQRVQAAAIERLSMHDALTDLPNRAFFINQLETAIAAGHAAGVRLAVLIMDLDRFKEVNDTLGHQVGDQLLQQVALRLREGIRRAEGLCRLGGDEFAVLVMSGTEEDAVRQSGDLTRILEHPLALTDIDIQVGVSIGISLYPEHGSDAATLMRRAEVAMYHAKRHRTGFSVYSADIDPHSLRRLTLLGELRHALESDELCVQYQPKVRAGSRASSGVEALVRWYHPYHGSMSPNEFVPLAEETGLIRPLTRWVLDSVLHCWSKWNARGVRTTVAVNLSVRNLLDPKLTDMIANQLRRWNVPARYLELEITESDIMSDPDHSLRVLCKLDEMGIKLSIDDFGTGYSSLAYLKQLPVDAVKIDKSFVLAMEKDENDRVIVEATIDLAHKLGLSVVAEGAETARVMQILEELGCDAVQGFYVSRPLDEAMVLEWLLSAPQPEEPLIRTVPA